METNTFFYRGATFQPRKRISRDIWGSISAEKPTDALELLAAKHGTNLDYAHVWNVEKPEDPIRARYLSRLAANIREAIAYGVTLNELEEIRISRGTSYLLRLLYSSSNFGPTIEMFIESKWVPVREVTSKGWIELQEIHV